jgi:hypothetical protein
VCIIAVHTKKYRDFISAVQRYKEAQKRREELKKPSIVYECWAYKKGEGGLLHSSAYKKRYFIITDQQELRYYEYPEAHYQNREPLGKLSCVGMQVKDRDGKESIKGKECFTFTIQAKEEGSRVRHCACETMEEREKLLATIENTEVCLAETLPLGLNGLEMNTTETQAFLTSCESWDTIDETPPSPHERPRSPQISCALFSSSSSSALLGALFPGKLKTTGKHAEAEGSLVKQNALLQEKLQKQEEMLAYISHYIQSREALQIEIEHLPKQATPLKNAGNGQPQESKDALSASVRDPGQVVGTLGTYSHSYPPLYSVPPPCPPLEQDALLQEELQTQEEMSAFLAGVVHTTDSVYEAS